MALAGTIAGIAEAGDILGIDILNPLATDWAITNPVDGHFIIVPDTVEKFEFRGEQRISDYPLEKGAFASFNKVAQPFEIRMLMVCSGLNYAQNIASSLGLNLGSKYMQRGDFLDTLDYMLGTTDLFDIVTPDKLYANVNLVHYDFRKEARNGAIMLMVDAWFQEVRVTGGATYIKSDSPSASDPVDVGSVHPGDHIDVILGGGGVQ